MRPLHFSSIAKAHTTAEGVIGGKKKTSLNVNVLQTFDKQA